MEWAEAPWITWFEVTDIRGQVEDGQVAHWQVTMKPGFTLDA
jgi:flavin-binding protein dodecin